jgi:hypothetical protein
MIQKGPVNLESLLLSRWRFEASRERQVLIRPEAGYMEIIDRATGANLAVPFRR